MKNEYRIIDNLVYIDIKKEDETLSMIIDKEDFDLIDSYKNTWKPNIKNGKVESIVNRVQQKGIRHHYKIHNIIMNCPKDKVVDHINGNTLDNRKCNLRICTRRENSQNVHIRNSKTGVRNVTIESGKYRVRINGSSYGCYNTLEEAKKIAEEKRKLHFNLPVFQNIEIANIVYEMPKE
jgi:hypothetical protein